MSRYFSYINSATEILFNYVAEEPFASYLKKYFSQHKKFGSRDRKQISHLCYCFFRLGKSLGNIPLQERILTGLFLCLKDHDELISELKPEWKDSFSLSFKEKCLLVNNAFSVDEVFPWQNELSEGINISGFIKSFFIQPDLFLRIRPGKENITKEKLSNAAIDFTILDKTCLSLTNTSKADQFINIDEDAVIQDLSSQRIGEILKIVKNNISKEKKYKVWDCCAASGGKSILAKDVLGNFDLTVTDIRESVLHNLKKRFLAAGINKYKSVKTDLSAPLKIKIDPFDLIIADVPCTGSGTWGRTPEQLFYFEKEDIDEFSSLQQKIISNVVPHLKAGGYLLYITCSVFKKENEEMISFIRENYHFEVMEEQLLKGYDIKADTMFAALLKKTL